MKLLTVIVSVIMVLYATAVGLAIAHYHLVAACVVTLSLHGMAILATYSACHPEWDY